MKKIRILEAIRQGKIGGGETHVLELVSTIDKSVFEPIVLSFTPGPMVDELKRIGIEVHVIETERGFDRKVWKKVRHLAQELKIDIIHAHGTRANSNVFMAARNLGVPLIYTIHGWSFHRDQSLPVRMVREMSERFLTSVSASNICVSFSNQQDGITGWKMKRSSVIYNGINTSKFNPAGSYRDVRKELGIPGGKTVAGFIVRMTIQKDPFTLIRAMKIVKEKCSEIVLLMIGEGDLKDEAVTMAKKLDLTDTVIFENFRQDVPDVLNAIDIYCLPSLWEGLPIGILEAMSMGKPVVATPVDGTREIITNGENGILIPVGDEKTLAEAILTLHYDPEMRKRISEKAIVTIRERFSVDQMVRQIEDHYGMIVNKRK